MTVDSKAAARPALSVRMPKKLVRMDLWWPRQRCGCAVGWLHQELISEPVKVSTAEALEGLYDLGFPEGSLGQLMKLNDTEMDDEARLEKFRSWCVEHGIEVRDE
jgi:hypothetical protein